MVFLRTMVYLFIKRRTLIHIPTITTGIIAYLIGAIPTGYIISRLKGISDIRKYGSGNIGATNVSRVLGMHYFFLIFFLDAGKSFLFIRAVTPYYTTDCLYFFATLVLIGNGYSIFLRGSGGKGVATLCGLFAALNASITAAMLIIWVLLLALTRTVGIASVGAVVCLPGLAYKTLEPISCFLFSLFAMCWIIYAHRSNIYAYWNI